MKIEELEPLYTDADEKFREIILTMSGHRMRGI